MGDEVHGGGVPQKTLTMERHVSVLRALVIGFNITAYFVFFGPGSPRYPLAMTVVIVAGVYGVWSLLTRPYERFPLLRFGALTLATDTTLITIWVLATGGPQSEFWVIYLVSIVSVAMRYDLRQTIAAASIEASMYVGAMLFDGGLTGRALAIRSVYILLVGLAAGLLARQERTTNEERERFEDLAAEHARLLERERGMVEQLRELDHLKTEFVAAAAHELRTPLTTLAGLASTLGHRWNELDPDQVETSLASMRRQGDRARVLIDNLLDLSALERGRLMLALTPVSIDSVVRNALETAPPPDGKNVEASVGPARAVADPSRLEQVLTNLLTNAYRYGGSSIRLRVEEEEATVVITVSDDGSGVAPDVTAHLFEPFGRAADVHDQPGSGLGLAIARKLVQAFGGEMWYAPGDPRGAVFGIRLQRAA